MTAKIARPLNELIPLIKDAIAKAEAAQRAAEAERRRRLGKALLELSTHIKPGKNWEQYLWRKFHLKPMEAWGYIHFAEVEKEGQQ